MTASKGFLPLLADKLKLVFYLPKLFPGDVHTPVPGSFLKERSCLVLGLPRQLPEYRAG